MPSPLRIGIAGLGTVGAAVVKLLDRQAETLARRTGRQIVIRGVSAARREKDRGVDLSRVTWYDDSVALAKAPDIDLFVELIGGEDGVALAVAEAALGAGKSFVTANKALLAKHGMRLAHLAEENGVALAFEASVAGGIPIVKTLREGLAGIPLSASTASSTAPAITSSQGWNRKASLSRNASRRRRSLAMRRLIQVLI